MGNCAGYCISDNPDNKKKVTMEQKEDGQFQNNNVAYINENKQEFEIEYGRPDNQFNHSKTEKFKGHEYEPNDKINMGPTTLANGSTYTGERLNGKKHGHGV